MVPGKFKDYKNVNVTINTCEYRYIIIISYDVFLTVNRPSIKIFTVFFFLKLISNRLSEQLSNRTI